MTEILPPEPILTVRRVAAMRAQIAAWRKQGLRVALVPTMGALHSGHVSLTRLARANAERVIVSIFVNPTQFAPHEDFARYPRTLEKDAALLKASEAADLIFAPALEDMYPEGDATRVEMRGPAQGLESDARPHFFGGVATVVAKLLIQAWPDCAVFGEKDYQQLQVIRRLVRDLDLPVRILRAPTLREADGLAMSSRNAYLKPQERQIAGALNAIMKDLAKAVARGQEPALASAEARVRLIAAGFHTVDYVEVRDAQTLSRALRPGAARRVLIAARVGQTRLIDNMAVD